MENPLTRVLFKWCPPLARSWRKQNGQIGKAIDETKEGLEEEKTHGRAVSAEADRVINTLNKGNQP